MAPIRILGIHGLGGHEGTGWEKSWSEAVTAAFPKFDELELDFQFVNYDKVFEKANISPVDTALAAIKLGFSGMTSPFHRRARMSASEMQHKLHWTAGYVVAWVQDDDFKAKTRELVLDEITKYKPDIVLAHSLGSLISYDALGHADAQKVDATARAVAHLNYVTLGSQLANPFVRRNLVNGRLQPLPVRFWHHLFNENDKVLTAEIKLPTMPAFRQVFTPFDDADASDHTAESYFRHQATIDNVWRPIGGTAAGLKAPALRLPTKKEVQAKSPIHKKQKALLVGINDYPDPTMRLEGCVNDVFTMSSVLQQSGFPPEAIRVCLNERATRDGILDRLKWLLNDAQPNDELVFYYSGHGARMAEYGESTEPDRHVESFVPYDFDWTPEKAITDASFCDLYSQLPYECRFVIIIDACHSRGMRPSVPGQPDTRAPGRPASRAHGMTRVRSIAPPDDIGHRELKWDLKTRMWVPRDFQRLNTQFDPRRGSPADYFGQNGATERLGRATSLRQYSATQYKKKDKTKSALEAAAPYLPLIIEACGEEEYAYEYRHGATSHGAFTFCLAKILMENKTIKFENLVGLVGKQLAELQYAQTPGILGPEVATTANVPWIS